MPGASARPTRTWKPVPLSLSSPIVYKQTSGTVTHESFYTTTSTASSDEFSFFSKANCNGAPLGVGASAVATYYTGVYTAAPLDAPAVGTSGSSAAPAPAAITTQTAGDELVSAIGSGGLALGTTISQAGNGLSPAVGINNANTAVPPPAWKNPGANTPLPTTSDNAVWTAETMALRPLGQTGIVVQRPAAPAANDFIVVTVTANGLPATDNICAPNDGTWTEIGGAPVTRTSGAVTVSQATWYSFRSDAATESLHLHLPELVLIRGRHGNGSGKRRRSPVQRRQSRLSDRRRRDRDPDLQVGQRCHALSRQQDVYPEGRRPVPSWGRGDSPVRSRLQHGTHEQLLGVRLQGRQRNDHGVLRQEQRDGWPVAHLLALPPPARTSCGPHRRSRFRRPRVAAAQHAFTVSRPLTTR